MPPASRTGPMSDACVSVIRATVSFRSRKTRWLSCRSASPAGVMRMRRPMRRKTASLSSSSSSSTCRLIADCETFSFWPAAVKEPVSAMARMISSWRRSMRERGVRMVRSDAANMRSLRRRDGATGGYHATPAQRAESRHAVVGADAGRGRSIRAATSRHRGVIAPMARLGARGRLLLDVRDDPDGAGIPIVPHHTAAAQRLETQQLHDAHGPDPSSKQFLRWMPVVMHVSSHQSRDDAIDTTH